MSDVRAMKNQPVSTGGVVRAGRRLLLRLAAAASLAGLSATAFGQSYTEDFDNIATLPGFGWVIQNNSTVSNTSAAEVAAAAP